MNNNILIVGRGKTRSSNLELYRILVMLLIVAHHYVVLSGLNSPSGPLTAKLLSVNSLYLYLFGMWGKTGINCFLMITGFFMCTSNISLRKFLKLYLWVVIYNVIITSIFVLNGTIPVTLKLLLTALPFTNIHTDNFTSSFMVWWLFIPFLNILLNGMVEKQHKMLMTLLIVIFSIYPFVPKVLYVTNNPICWFSTIYVIASYIRKYPENIYKSQSSKFWCGMTILLALIAMISVLTLLFIGEKIGKNIPVYYMVSDSDKPLALMIAFSSFLWFKNLEISYNKWINILGGASFGVLLIHSNSRAMMNWLWKDTIDCVGQYDLPLWHLIGYSIGCVLLIYVICTIIDYTRLKLIEEPFFNWYNKKSYSFDNKQKNDKNN